MRYGLLLLVLGFLLTGCVSVVPPRVEVVGAEVAEVSPEGARLEVGVVLSNPREVAMPLFETSYTLDVEGVGSYSYVDLPGKVINAYGAQSLMLPAAITAEGQTLAGRAWSIHGSVKYTPESRFRDFLTETGVPLPIVFFSGEGTLE